MTHCLNVMHAPVKFHEYVPYGLGVMARTGSGTYGRTYGTDRGNTLCPSAILRIGGGIKMLKNDLLTPSLLKEEMDCAKLAKI